jgi:integrase
MASLQLRGSSYRFIFRYHGKQHFVQLGPVAQEEAEAKAAQVDYLLLRLKQGLIALPAGVDIVTFLQRDGKPPEPGERQQELPIAGPLTLEELRDQYFKAHGRSLEPRTIDTGQMHFRHLVATLGAKYPIGELDVSALQRHVDRRAAIKRADGKLLSEVTIKKEITALRAAWNWAAKRGMVPKEYPNDGLTFPKGDDKPPFKTLDEINRRLNSAKLTPAQRKELCETLYLRPAEIKSFLAIVREHAAYAWIYPLLTVAAYTGARRSELIRLQIADVDFESNTITINEKKRVKGKRSQRIAPLSPAARAALKDWIRVHPGGETLFAHGKQVTRSRKRSATTGHINGPGRPKTVAGRLATIKLRTAVAELGPLTPSEIHDHFRRTLRGTPFAIVRGLHVLRHSFISGLAAAGIDQRIIDDIVGHTSEEMRRRYRHLTPEAKTQAIARVFQ